jgi:hypothetical protein
MQKQRAKISLPWYNMRRKLQYVNRLGELIMAEPAALRPYP